MMKLTGISIINSQTSFFPSEIEEWCLGIISNETNLLVKEKVIDFWFRYFINTSGPNPECRYFVKKSKSAGGELFLSRDRFDESEKKQYVICARTFDESGEQVKKATVELLTSKEVSVVKDVLGAIVQDLSIVELRH